MQDIPYFALVLIAAGVFALAVFGLRGVLEIRSALRSADFDTLVAPERWQITRAFCGLCLALPVFVAAAALGPAAMAAAALAGGLGYAAAPRFLASALQRARQELLDELALHLDLMALMMESGSSLAAALATCAARAPDGILRRAWSRVAIEVHGGVDLFEALRALDQRLDLRPLSTLVTALRSADRMGLDMAAVLRERARQAAANRFARAERHARAAPLKLWATLMLCIAPCTLILLSFPVARILALAVNR